MLISEGAVAELLEVLTSLRSQVSEELDEDFVSKTVDVYIQIDVGSARSVLYQVLIGVVSFLLINQVTRLIHVSELIENPILEGLAVSDVDVIIVVD